MDLESFRNMIACIDPQKKPKRNIIATGMLEDNKSTLHAYEITHGWDITLSYDCDNYWKQHTLSLFEIIDKNNYSDEELQKVLSSINIEDFHWDWFKKSYCFKTSEYEWFYFLAQDKPQGACVFYHPKKSAFDDRNIFYIEYIAVAPWNRKTLVSDRLFKGIGSILIKSALHYAVESLGLCHGFSLNALPNAVTYYQKIGMVHFPGKEKQTLPYFEMPEEKSIAILEAP